MLQYREKRSRNLFEQRRNNIITIFEKKLIYILQQITQAVFADQSRLQKVSETHCKSSVKMITPIYFTIILVNNTFRTLTKNPKKKSVTLTIFVLLISNNNKVIRKSFPLSHSFRAEDNLNPLQFSQQSESSQQIESSRLMLKIK